MVKVKPKRGKLRKKIKQERSLGALVVLGALLLAGYFAQHQGPGRSPFVWEDFDKRQGIYLGHYVKRGHDMLAFRAPEGIICIEVDPAVSFTHMPLVGMPCEVSFTKGEYPKIVRTQDVVMLDLPNGAGQRYEPWRH